MSTGTLKNNIYERNSVMKKAISVVLLSALIVSSAACAGETNYGGTTDLTSFEDISMDAEADLYSLLPERDLDGMEIKIFGYGAGGYNYVDSEAFEAEETGEPVDDAIYKRNLDTEARLGVKLTYDHSFHVLWGRSARRIAAQNV